MVFDYIDGGADDEITLRRNTARFLDHELLWEVLADVSAIDTSAQVLGQAVCAPIIIAPTASSRLFNPRAGERAVARASESAISAIFDHRRCRATFADDSGRAIG